MNHPPHILVIEDHLVTMTVHKSLLETLGCRVDCAEDANQATALFKEHPYDLILMDIGLSGLNGIQTTYALRSLESQSTRTLTPIVAITGHNDAAQRTQCMAAGMNGVFGKPFTIEAAQLMLANFVGWALAQR